MEIKKLNKELIQKANNNSFGGKRGDITEHDYEIYCQRVIGWNLSEKKTQKIVDKIYRYFSRSLALEAEHVSVAVAGASNYNAKKLDKSDKILSNSAEFCEWFKEIESEATQKPFDKIEWLKKEIIWSIQGTYSATKQWKELAARNRDEFNKLYEALNKVKPFKKTSTPYKIYNDLIKIEPISQKLIYADDDFCAYEEQGKICIKFRMKPQRQLIVALKSRKFVWISSEEVWRTNSSDELVQFAKSIATVYEEYI